MPARIKVLFACTEVFAHGGIQRFNRTLLAALEELAVECDVYSLNDSASPAAHAHSPPAAPASAPYPSGSGQVRSAPQANSHAAQVNPAIPTSSGEAAALANACACSRATPQVAAVRGFGRSKVRFAVALVWAILTGRYDRALIGHVHFAALIMVAMRLRRLVGRIATLGARSVSMPRTLLVAHGTEVWSRVEGIRRWAVGAADRVLCVSEYTRRRIEEQAPEVERARLAMFPNALNRSWVERYEALEGATAQVREMPETFILSVARLNRADRTKGIITTIEALALLDESVHYVIVGHGDDAEFLKHTARRLHVEKRVHFPGAVPDEELVGLYRQCAAFVLPSSQEGFGIVFLEAMFFGAPVIAAREKGATDVVRDFETGLLVPYGDLEALAGVITKLLSDHILRDRLQSRARATVSGDGVFTFRAFVNRCAAALECHQSVSCDC